mmetsp:Transcript_15082/g.37051  ORF Transcript_15082/g.37051 Transcript_15082/m.37051 type:complete len:223 (+) Transcript_15082:417-1085(+)
MPSTATSTCTAVPRCHQRRRLRQRLGLKTKRFGRLICTKPSMGASTGRRYHRSYKGRRSVCALTMDPPSPSLPIKIPFSITPSPPLPPPPPQLIGWGVPSWHLLANHRPPLPHPPLEVYCHGRRRRRRVTLVMPSPRCSTPCASLGARRPTRKGGWCRYRRRQRRSQRRGRPPSSGPPCCSHRRQRCCCRRRHRSCRHHHGLRRSCRRRSCRFLILYCQSLR